MTLAPMTNVCEKLKIKNTYQWVVRLRLGSEFSCKLWVVSD